MLIDVTLQNEYDTRSTTMRYNRIMRLKYRVSDNSLLMIALFERRQSERNMLKLESKFIINDWGFFGQSARGAPSHKQLEVWNDTPIDRLT
jgi:hypothetical protein